MKKGTRKRKSKVYDKREKEPPPLPTKSLKHSQKKKPTRCYCLSQFQTMCAFPFFIEVNTTAEVGVLKKSKKMSLFQGKRKKENFNRLKIKKVKVGRLAKTELSVHQKKKTSEKANSMIKTSKTTTKGGSFMSGHNPQSLIESILLPASKAMGALVEVDSVKGQHEDL